MGDATNERVLLIPSIAMDRAYGRDGWRVTNNSLVEYVKTGAITHNIEFSVCDNPTKAMDIISGYGHRVEGNSAFIEGVKVTLIRADPIPVVRDFISNYQRNSLNIPVDIGSVLDSYSPTWSDVKSNRKVDNSTAFFTYSRRKEAHEQISVMCQ